MIIGGSTAHNVSSDSHGLRITATISPGYWYFDVLPQLTYKCFSVKEFIILVSLSSLKIILTSDIRVSEVLIIFSSMGRSTRDNDVSVITIYVLFIVAL